MRLNVRSRARAQEIKTTPPLGFGAAACAGSAAPAPARGFRRRLGVVARFADRLEIGQLVGATLGLRHNVVDSDRAGDPTFLPAWHTEPVVTLKRFATQLSPRCSVSTCMARTAQSIRLPTDRLARMLGAVAGRRDQSTASVMPTLRRRFLRHREPQNKKPQGLRARGYWKPLKFLTAFLHQLATARRSLAATMLPLS